MVIRHVRSARTGEMAAHHLERWRKNRQVFARLIVKSGAFAANFQRASRGKIF
jgi:hypothetical protein